MNKSPHSFHLIRFPDCDPFNHLNNSRYIDYFINAREDHIVSNYGFNIYSYAKEKGKGWVVRENRIMYLSPAFLIENVMIQSTLLELNSSDVLVEMRMWNESGEKLKALMWSRFVHYDLMTFKKAEHPEELTSIFSAFLNPLSVGITFDERVNAVRNMRFDRG